MTPNPDALREARPSSSDAASRRGERGYTLAALLVMMTIMAIAAVSVAPSIRQQRQRELEEDAIARGEEIADAIRLYASVKGSPPTSIDQLLEGVNVGTKKVQIMRPFAARDPLSKSGEWRLIQANDKALLDFQVDLSRYAGNRPVQPRPLPGVQVIPRVTGVVDMGRDDEEEEEREARPCDESAEPGTSGGPFVGVASESLRKSVITYYGIECHSHWVFTPLFR